jgi:hypothetical protein
MSAASQSSPLHSAGSGRRAFLAVFAVALVIHTAGVVAIPDGWWEVAFAIPWALATVMVLDHLHGSGEFSRLGSGGRFLALFFCIALAASRVELRLDGLWGWLAFAVTITALLVAVELVGRLFGPRYRGRGVNE